MSDPRDYVPPEVIVRASVDAPRAFAPDLCPTPPWTGDALLHVAECASCQATLDAEAVAREGYDDALAYIPSGELVARVLSASARRRYRVHLLAQVDVVHSSHWSLRKRAAALFGAWALSPAVLAAAVVVHVAIVAALANVTVYAVAAPEGERHEQVDYVPLVMYGPPPRNREIKDAELRARAAAVAQEMPVASVQTGLTIADRERLDSTVAWLRRDRGARVLLTTGSSRDALAAAEVVGRYLITHGVPRAQVKIVAGGASTAGRVEVTLDTRRRVP